MKFSFSVALKFVTFLLGIFAIGITTVAYSQTTENTSFALSSMKPNYTMNGILGSSSSMIPKRRFGFNIGLGWEYERLLMSYQGLNTTPLIQQRMLSHLQGWWRIKKWLLLGTNLPISLLQNRESKHLVYGQLDSLDQVALGDMTVSAQFQIPISSENYHLGFLIDFSIPTATSNSYLSQALSFEQLSILQDYQWSRIHLIHNLAYRKVQIQKIFNQNVDDLLSNELAIRALLDPRKQWSIESMLHYHTSASNFGRANHETYARLGMGKLWNLHSNTPKQSSQIKLNLYVDKAFVFDVMTASWQAGAYVQWQNQPLTKRKARVKVIKVDQISDQDRDGIKDQLDLCPNLYGHLDAKGCPLNDIDGDRVLNARDLCRYTFGHVDNSGCPKDVFAIDDLIKEPILFNNERSELNQQTQKKLRLIVKAMRRYPKALIHIAAHSDYLGSEQFNMVLSKLRGKKVYAALVKAGIAPTRISLTAYGEKHPIIRRKNPEDRRKNRRVVITWILPPELSKITSSQSDEPSHSVKE